MNRKLPFHLFTFSLIIGILLPTLLRDGMFVDGVVYSAISKNLAHGIGSWFSPQFSSSAGSVFFEHPPLGFILQSAFFKVLGDSIYTERFYSFLMALLSVWGIIFCLKKIDAQKYRNIYWLAVLLWILTPTISWAYKNNMLENTMSVFILFSAGFSIKAVKQKNLLLLVLSALFICLSVLTKGFAGLFPLIVPAAYAMLFESEKRFITAFKYTVLLTSFAAGILLLTLLISPDLRSNIMHYLQQQVIPALQDKREITTQNHLNILFLLVKELLIPVGITLMILVLTILMKFRNLKIAETKSEIIFFLIIALCGSIPLIITLKQRAFYLVPSIPFYVLALSLFLVNPVSVFIEQLKEKTLIILRYSSFVTLIISLVFSITFMGKVSRDEMLLKDVHKICALVPNNQIISAIPVPDNYWILSAYLVRYGNIGIDKDIRRKYILTSKNDTTDFHHQGYFVMDSGLQLFVLYVKAPENLPAAM